jgi:predicted 2-oxoglutarate/Fe(II)-dependent dioxygenase YbiX
VFNLNTELEKNNYVFIPRLIDPERARKIGSEYESFAEYYQLGGDEQAPYSRAAYDYKPALELLCELTPKISNFTGLTVLPTYSYIRVYQTGDDLKKHSDRDSCEISITLNLNGDCDWPFHVERPDGSIASLIMQPGDAILYLGCKATHWRDTIPGSKCVQVFLHYVDSNGPKSSSYFDKAGIGQDHFKKLLNIPKASFEHEYVDYSKMPRDLKGFVNVFEDVMSLELCDRIIEEYQNDENWLEASVGSGVINDAVRRVNIIKIDDPYIVYKNHRKRAQLHFELSEAMFLSIQKYRQIAPSMSAEKHSGYDLLRYQEGDFYKEHTDSYISNLRHVSCSFILNDDYEGGEFAFLNREFKIKAKKGSVIMFPSNFMFPHEILPVIKGTRYSIITWLI